MATNSQGMVDARFFGAHDRAWVPVKDCYLFSRKDPNSNNIQKNNINECIKVSNKYLEFGFDLTLQTKVSTSLCSLQKNIHN